MARQEVQFTVELSNKVSIVLSSVLLLPHRLTPQFRYIILHKLLAAVRNIKRFTSCMTEDDFASQTPGV